VTPSASLSASTTDAFLYRTPSNLSSVMSPSDCVKWRIGPWGTSTKPATTTTGMPAASALSVPLRVFDRYASLRFDAECRRSSKAGGAGGPPMATVAHALFRQRTALRMPIPFSLRNWAGPFEVWLLPGHGRRAASVCMACPRVVRRVALPVCRPPAGLSVPTIARTERPRCPRGAVQRPAASPCPPDTQVHSDAGREHKRG
jgi:hypothetical protein